MEAFTIQCSTCQSLIRVRNAKLIGQIANCPKCNSMIKIAEPQPQIRVESQGPAVDSNAMTKEAFEPLDGEYRLADGSDAAPSYDGSTSPSFAAPLVTSEPLADWEPTEAGPLMPSEQWTSPDAARKRQILMVVFLGASGVLLSGLLFFAFLRWYSVEEVDVPTVAQVPQNNAVANDSIAQPADPDQEPLVPPLTDGASESLLPENSATETPAAPQQTETGIDDKTPLPAVADVSDGARPDKETDAATNAPNSIDAAATVTEGNELPKQLEKFAELLGSARIIPQLPPDVAVIDKPPLTADDLGLTKGSNSKALPTVDVSRQLQLQLSGLILNELPASHAINLWVQISGVPTVVDIDSLAAAGVNTNQTVSLAYKGPEPFKLAEVADEISNQLGLVFERINNEYMVVHSSSDALEKHLPTEIKITDLVSNAEQQQWLFATLDQLFPSYTGKWQISDGNLSRDAGQVDIASWMWIVRMLESWRLAAGMQSQLKELDAKQFVTKFVNVNNLQALDQPMQIVTLQSTPAAQLISQICSANKLQAWVDWVSVGQNGLGYNSADMVITHQRTLRQALKYYVDKYALVIAGEDDSSLWITTPQSYRSQVRLYVLPSQGKTAEQWQEELEPLTPTGLAGIEAVQAMLTPDSQFVIVRCCRPRIDF